MNPFTKLGLPTTATKDEVTKAWRKLCMIHHPDRGGSDVEFIELNAAYKQALTMVGRPHVTDNSTLSDFVEIMRRAERAAKASSTCEICKGRGTVEIRYGINTARVMCVCKR